MCHPVSRSSAVLQVKVFRCAHIWNMQAVVMLKVAESMLWEEQPWLSPSFVFVTSLLSIQLLSSVHSTSWWHQMENEEPVLTSCKVEQVIPPHLSSLLNPLSLAWHGSIITNVAALLSKFWQLRCWIRVRSCGDKVKGEKMKIYVWIQKISDYFPQFHCVAS